MVIDPEEVTKPPHLLKKIGEEWEGNKGNRPIEEDEEAEDVSESKQG